VLGFGVVVSLDVSLVVISISSVVLVEIIEVL
jgi:hypothetical protein